MSTRNLSPKTPAPGYALRWAAASLDLMTRRPLRIAGCVLAGIVAMVFVQLAIVLSMQEIGAVRPAVAVMISISRTILAQAVILFLFVEFGFADDVGPAEPAPYLRSLGTIVSGLTVYMLFLGVFEALAIAGAAAPEHVDLQPALYSRLPEWARLAVFLADAGAGDLITGAYAMGFFGFFAYPLCVMMDVQGKSLRMIGHLTTMRLFFLFLSMAVLSIPGLVILTSLPFFLSLPVFVLYVGWIYAGAREIFTGQAENSPRRAASPSFAASPA